MIVLDHESRLKLWSMHECFEGHFRWHSGGGTVSLPTDAEHGTLSGMEQKTRLVRLLECLKSCMTTSVDNLLNKASKRQVVVHLHMFLLTRYNRLLQNNHTTVCQCLSVIPRLRAIVCLSNCVCSYLVLSKSAMTHKMITILLTIFVIFVIETDAYPSGRNSFFMFIQHKLPFCLLRQWRFHLGWCSTEACWLF